MLNPSATTPGMNSRSGSKVSCCNSAAVNASASSDTSSAMASVVTTSPPRSGHGDRRVAAESAAPRVSGDATARRPARPGEAQRLGTSHKCRRVGRGARRGDPDGRIGYRWRWWWCRQIPAGWHRRWSRRGRLLFPAARSGARSLGHTPAGTQQTGDARELLVARAMRRGKRLTNGVFEPECSGSGASRRDQGGRRPCRGSCPRQ